MRATGLTLTAIVLGLAVAGASAFAQQSSASAGQASKPAAKPASIPRLADGRPDLQGNWTNATITMFERRPNTPLVITEEAARDRKSVV